MLSRYLFFFIVEYIHVTYEPFSGSQVQISQECRKYDVTFTAKRLNMKI